MKINRMSEGVIFSVCILSVMMMPCAAGYRDAKTGIAFPDSLGGIPYNDIDVYDRPGYGYSVSYKDGEKLTVNIYVYKGIYTTVDQTIPEGHETPETREEMNGIIDGLRQAVDAGVYADMKPGKRTVYPAKGPIQFWRQPATMRIPRSKHPGDTFFTESFLTACARHFIKVRMTWAEPDYPAGKPDIETFIDDLIRVLDGRDPVAHSPIRRSLLAAMGRFKADPLSDPGRRAAEEILIYAIEAEDVIITVVDELMPWLDDESFEYGDLLFIAYVTGNIEPQFRSGIMQDHPYEGMLQVLNTYDRIRQAKPFPKIKQIETWRTMRNKGMMKTEIERIFTNTKSSPEDNSKTEKQSQSEKESQSEKTK